MTKDTAASCVTNTWPDPDTGSAPPNTHRCPRALGHASPCSGWLGKAGHCSAARMCPVNLLLCLQEPQLGDWKVVPRLVPAWGGQGSRTPPAQSSPVQARQGTGPALHPRNLQLVHWVTPGASSSTWTNTGEGKSTTAASKKPHLFENKKLRGNEKTKALLSLVLSSRGNETSKAPIQRRVGGREIPLQTHLSEQLLKWKCRSSETFKFPPTAREEEGGSRTSRDSSAMQIQTGVHSGQHPGGPVERGFVRELIRTGTRY